MPGDKLFDFLKNQVEQSEDVKGMLEGKDDATNNVIDRLTGGDKREAQDTANSVFWQQYGDMVDKYAKQKGTDLSQVGAKEFEEAVLAAGMPKDAYDKWQKETEGF